MVAAVKEMMKSNSNQISLSKSNNKILILQNNVNILSNNLNVLNITMWDNVGCFVKKKVTPIFYYEFFVNHAGVLRCCVFHLF